MKITMACYQAVSMIHGGPRVQILRTKQELEKLGVEVSLFDPWRPFSETTCELFHLFSANVGTFHLARNVQSLHLPMVTSPIFFTRHSPGFIRSSLSVEHALKRFRSGIWTDYGYTEQICRWSRAVLPNTSDESRLINKGLGIPKETISVVPNGVESRFEFGDPALFKKKYGCDGNHYGSHRGNNIRIY